MPTHSTDHRPTLGMIGAGFHATTNILPALRIAGLVPDAVATRSPVTAAAALRSINPDGTAYGSAAELLADASIDAVIIVAQPADQTRLTREAIAAGKHVFVDKPLGWKATEARVVAREADEAGRTVVVGFMKRYAPVYRQVRDIIASGDLGALRSFSVHFGCDSTPFCANDEEFLKLAAIHLVDLVRYLFGEVVTVMAVSSGEGNHVALAVTLTFASGVAGTLDLTGLPSRSSETESLRISGSRGYLETSESSALRVHLVDEVQPSWGSLSERTTMFTPAGSAMSGVGGDLRLRGFVGELEEFVRGIQSGEPSVSDAWSNVGTMQLCDRILESAAAHRVPAAMDASTLVPVVFGEPGAFRDEMVSRILSGRKTGTSTIRLAYETRGEALPMVGERRALIGSSGHPVAVLEFTEVVETSFDAVDLDLASHESASVDDWRAGHRAYFETLTGAVHAHLGDTSWSADAPGPVVVTVFCVAEVLTAA